MSTTCNVLVEEMEYIEITQKLKNKRKAKEMLPLLIMLIPMVLYLLIFNYYPMLGLQMAFKDYRVYDGIWGSPWAKTKGELDLFKHFKELFSDENFFKTFGNTLRISCLRLFVGFPVPIIITILLNEIIILFIAMLTAMIVSLFVIKKLLDFIKKHSFKSFGIYRIVLGVIILIIYFL